MRTPTRPAPGSAARFDALGTYVYVATRRGAELDRAVRLTRRVLADVDQTCSRFRADSDLSRANQYPGHWVEVDPLLVAAVEAAVDAARQSEGLVHPLLGRALVRLGYDADLRVVTAREDESPAGALDEGGAVELSSWQGIGLDRQGAVRVPAGTALDLGSSAKAWAADLVGTALGEELEGSALVSLGGDLRISRPDGLAWPVDVSERPGGPPEARIGLDSGGLATSSTLVRRWRRAGVVRHHLLDPRTGLPVVETWRTVTATGATCLAANTASTAAIVLGPEAPAWLSQHAVTARLVGADGVVVRTGDWPHPGEA